MINTLAQNPYMPFGLGLLSGASIASIVGLLLLIMIPVIILKGLSLWHAVKRNEKWWFVILLVVNTLGLLELIYLIFVAKVVFFRKTGQSM